MIAKLVQRRLRSSRHTRRNSGLDRKPQRFTASSPVWISEKRNGGKVPEEPEAVIRQAQAFNDLLQDCLKHHHPVFTLELPDEILLKLLDYGSVGEILLGFKMSEETRQDLQTKLGKEGFALLGSRLITKGLLKANDPIFNRKWG